MSVRSRLLSVAAITAGLLLIAPAAYAADGIPSPAPIGPNQAFVGEVNGVTSGATLKMACFGPVRLGQTGHPMDGQTVTALPISTDPKPLVPGYTGSQANSIGVGFNLASTGTAVPIVLTYWGVPGKIPTTLTLPCYGTGTVTFQPLPTSPTARAFTMSVTFVGQP